MLTVSSLDIALPIREILHMRQKHPRAERLYKTLGVRVREIRKARGETQESLARRIRTARTTITNLEKGDQAVPLHQLYAISEALDVELSEILPTRSEIAVAEVTPVEIRGVAAPKTANLITNLLADQ